MNIRLLKYALALEKYRSFQHAARASNISPSGLSRAIQALEDEYGLKLFDRGGQEILPTPAGREFISGARLMAHYADDLETRMKALHQATAGSVAFGLAPLPAGLYLSSFLIGMLRDAPQINVHARTGPASDLAPQLNDGGIEFLICANSAILDQHVYQVEALHSFDLYLMVRNGHPLTRLKRVIKEDLDPFPLLGGSFQNNMWPASRVPIAMHSICNSYEAIFATVAATDACCLSPKIRHGDGTIDPDAFAYVTLEKDVFETRASFILMRARERSLSLAAELAIAQFRTVMAKSQG